MKSLISNRAVMMRRVLDRYRLPLDGLHGPEHWARVARVGNIIANSEADVDQLVVELFALLHDSCRTHEMHCTDHGYFAAEFIRELFRDGMLYQLTTHQNFLLQHAVEYHCYDYTNLDYNTVAACWDADRLDLWRVGIAPEPGRMRTNTGRILAEKAATRRVEIGQGKSIIDTAGKYHGEMIEAWPELFAAARQ